MTGIKLAQYLSALLLSAILSSSYAVDISNPESDLQGYCSESASLSGIEDSAERSQFISICMENLGGTTEPEKQDE
jgi:hypothetical protein